MPDGRLKAVIFDFDGVVLDSEPTHLAGFQAILARAGHGLTSEDYYARYLGFDDRQAFVHMATDLGFSLDEDTLRAWVSEKSRLVLRQLRGSAHALPGVVHFVEAMAAAGVRLAVASGALNAEVRAGLEAIGILTKFDAIVGADDTSRSKPAPDPYLAALDRLGMTPGGIVAIEDSPAGIESARAAGLTVAAVTNSYPAAQLADADLVIDSLEGLMVPDLERALSGRP
jgi:beta-phosphoglucomutase